ncbi:Uncharacterized protein TCM_030819 [Theobroma cacao]|uniref:Uncharacterized protein n=1 Tax=Theobroma cacao TaxID=3641 RepID=A0A061F5F1_THECC|nr:Uncharacterized protein TCM_030819 [Theobroma cacao]
MDEVMTAASASAWFRSASSPTSIVPSNVPLLSAVLAFALARFLNLFTTCIGASLFGLAPMEIGNIKHAGSRRRDGILEGCQTLDGILMFLFLCPVP